MEKAVIEQKNSIKPSIQVTSIRMPEVQDGASICALVKKSTTLDVNSEYLYLLLGAHFKQTCALSLAGNQVAGFVSAYIPPNQLNVLFVWQVLVDSDFRKRGLALAMLKEILNRPCCAHIKFVHATISPSNLASRSLFSALAQYLGAKSIEKPMFLEQHFSGVHESEPLFEIGPLSN